VIVVSRDAPWLSRHRGSSSRHRHPPIATKTDHVADSGTGANGLIKGWIRACTLRVEVVESSALSGLAWSEIPTLASTINGRSTTICEHRRD
jgi:hypothetical protein